MKKRLKSFLLTLLFSAVTFAQGDKIIGTYIGTYDGVTSHIRFFKLNNGRYRGQVVYCSNLIKPDGSILLDYKNPDKKKRSVRADQIVIIEGLKYNEKKDVWDDSKLYSPPHGMSANAELSLKDEGNTLVVKAKLLGVTVKTVEWKRKKD